MQRWFKIHKSMNVIYLIKCLKNKNHMIISLDTEKAFDKIQNFFMIKVVEGLEVQEIYLTIIKVISSKSIVYTKLNRQKLKALPLKSTRQGC